MLLNPVSDGSVTSTGSLSFESGILGCVVITADGLNDATVTLKRTDTNGTKVFQIVTKSPMVVTGPFKIGASTGYYSVTGTGSGAQFYEWVS